MGAGSVVVELRAELGTVVATSFMPTSALIPLVTRMADAKVQLESELRKGCRRLSVNWRAEYTRRYRFIEYTHVLEGLEFIVAESSAEPLFTSLSALGLCHRPDPNPAAPADKAL